MAEVVIARKCPNCKGVLPESAFGDGRKTCQRCRNLAHARYRKNRIIPQASYGPMEIGSEVFRRCWHYRNLRLLPGRKNVQKSDALDADLIRQYGIADLLPEGL